MILLHSEQLFCVIIERKLLSIISSIYTIHNSSILNAKTFLNVLFFSRVKFNILTISISYIQIDLNHYLNRNKYKSLISKSSCHHELFDIAWFPPILKLFIRDWEFTMGVMYEAENGTNLKYMLPLLVYMHLLRIYFL